MKFHSIPGSSYKIFDAVSMSRTFIIIVWISNAILFSYHLNDPYALIVAIHDSAKYAQFIDIDGPVSIAAFFDDRDNNSTSFRRER